MGVHPRVKPEDDGGEGEATPGAAGPLSRKALGNRPCYSGSFFGSQSQAMMPNASSDSAPTPAAM